MKRYWLITLLMTLFPITAGAQYIKVCGDTNRTALYLNIDRVWNYNLYEHSRWGGGLRMTMAKRISFDGYLGYGTYDEQWKYGLAMNIRFRGPRQKSIYLSHTHDYFSVGSRHIDSPSADNTSLLGSFWSRRMTEQQRYVLGYRWRTPFAAWVLEAVWTESGRLFDDQELLYYNQGDVITSEGYWYGRLLMQHSSGLRLLAELGDWSSDGPVVARLLADYRKGFRLPTTNLQLYLQGGITPPSTDYEHMFDLGGLWGSPLYLRNNLMTARANEFTANAFSLLSLRLYTAKPLYKIYNSLFVVGSNPVPFVGLTAVWGTLWRQDNQGQCLWTDIHLQAPYKGLFEPIVGVDGLIRWGLVDWGVAAAYRITPSSATYHFSAVSDNLAFLVTATLHLETNKITYIRLR